MPIQQWPLPRRRDLIRELRSSRTGSFDHPLIFQSRLQTFPVYTVEIGFPCYRLSNGRTQSRQKEIVADEDLPGDYFAVDPDSAPALERQDQILRELVFNSETLKILKRDPQTQPLILDTDGYIINGNRRVCAMRLLLEEDEARYAHFRNVQVVLLPPCTDEDIAELEARLQIMPEGRQEYSWVDEAMMFRKARDQGWSDDRIADIYRQSPSDIRDAIGRLEDAEQFLQERGKPSNYSRVIHKDYAFKQLQKCNRRCNTDEAKKLLFTKVAYVMLDDPTAGGRRLYDSIPEAFKHLNAIQDNLLQELPPRPDEAVGGGEPSGDIDLLGDASQGDGMASLLARLDNAENLPKAMEVIQDTLEEMRSRERERRDAVYCLHCVQDAHTKLQSAMSALDGSAVLEGVEESLRNIETTVANIRGWLDARSTN